MNAQPKPLDQVRDRLRLKHYSLRTEESYVHWIKRCIYFHRKRHPAEMGGPEVEAFLTDLAVNGRVSPSTQNQALAALLFLYREVLGRDLPWMESIVRAKRPPRLPVVLTASEVRAVLAQMEGTRWLIASLLYGTGMRVMGLAVRVSVEAALARSLVGKDSPASPGREGRAARGSCGGTRSRHSKTGVAACTASQLCHASVASGI